MVDRLFEAANYMVQARSDFPDPIENDLIALLRSIANELPRIPDQTWVSHTLMAAEALADTILGDANEVS